MILEAVEDGKWKCMKIGRQGPKISYLMFADNLLLFGKATEDHMRLVKKILDNFCDMPGQRISYEKSIIYFSKSTNSLGRR